MIISTVLLATGAIGGLAASRWRYETPTLRVAAPGVDDGASEDGEAPDNVLPFKSRGEQG